MTPKEYNIAMIDTSDSVEVYGALNNYGKNGWMFVGWLDMNPPSEKLPFLKNAIFVRDLEEKV